MVILWFNELVVFEVVCFMVLVYGEDCIVGVGKVCGIDVG